MRSVIYFTFINPVYGVVQLFVALTIPLLKVYNGERGTWKGMKYLFYVYYPLHLAKRLKGLMSLNFTSYLLSKANCRYIRYKLKKYFMEVTTDD